jgi:hypothetical protein
VKNIGIISNSMIFIKPFLHEYKFKIAEMFSDEVNSAKAEKQKINFEKGNSKNGIILEASIIIAKQVKRIFRTK